MRNSIARKTIVAIAALTALSGTAVAEHELDRRMTAELNACVAAIRSSVDLDAVDRIRHVVVRSKPALLGRAFDVETSTFAGDVERQYSIYCVANGDNPPLTLTVDEV